VRVGKEGEEDLRCASGQLAICGHCQLTWNNGTGFLTKRRAPGTRATTIVKAESSGEDPKATGGLVSGARQAEGL